MTPSTGAAAVWLETEVGALRESDTFALDLSSAPGVELLLQKAWSAGGVRLEVACAAAGGGRWVAGLEDAALSGASAVAQKHLDLETIQAAPPHSSPLGFDQSFEGLGQGVRVRGRHLIRFMGDDHDVVLCTAACLEDAQNQGSGSATDSDAAACSEALESLRLRGELVAPPGPGALSHALAFAASHPRASAAGALALALAAVALLLRFRPRPRY